MKENIICSGALFYTLNTQRFLFLHRTQTKQNNVWGLVGGRNESEEIPYKALLREIEEEIGFVPDLVKSIPLETFISNDEKFSFHTYLCVVKEEFLPKLNHEHNGYAWVSFNNWPKPLHQGLRNTLQNKQNLLKLQTVFQLVSLIEK
jgi:8-oxo-dGTP pyrophosphatase MutT (NUDIX family)